MIRYRARNKRHSLPLSLSGIHRRLSSNQFDCCNLTLTQMVVVYCRAIFFFNRKLPKTWMDLMHVIAVIVLCERVCVCFFIGIAIAFSLMHGIKLPNHQIYTRTHIERVDGNECKMFIDIWCFVRINTHVKPYRKTIPYIGWKKTNFVHQFINNL